MEVYPGNSHKERKEQVQQEERKKLDKVISGNVKTRKKNAFQQAVSDNASKAKQYILHDVIIPTIKNAITKTVEVLVWGDDRRSKSAGSKVSYGSYYNDRFNQQQSRPEPRTNGFNYDDIIFDTRGEAEYVRSQLDDVMATYGMVRVSDLYDLVGLTCDYTYNNYGWTNIRNAEIRPTRDGYLLAMPRAIPLK